MAQTLPSGALSPSKKLHRRAFSPSLILASILVMLVLTGLACTQQSEPTPTLIPTSLPVMITGYPVPTPVPTNTSDETTGIILAGAVLVLIVLGGALGATRRKS